jgi:hypothetical protein
MHHRKALLLGAVQDSFVSVKAAALLRAAV